MGEGPNPAFPPGQVPLPGNGWFRGHKKISPRAAGSAALEFALVAPLFLILTFGVLDFGLAMHAKGLITHASQEGASFGVAYRLAPPTAADIQAHVLRYLQGAGFSEPVTLTVTGAGGVSGTPLSVRIEFTYHFLALPNFLTALWRPQSVGGNGEASRMTGPRISLPPRVNDCRGKARSIAACHHRAPARPKLQNLGRPPGR